MDYSELVKDLRRCSSGDESCESCKRIDTIACMPILMSEAADAIEELANARNELSAMCLKLTRTIDEMEKENMRHERRDGF